MTEKFQVLATGTGATRKFSVVETTTYIGGRQKLETYIPDTGDENKANTVARLLNKEYNEVQERRAKQEAEEQAERDKAMKGGTSLG